MRHIDLNNLLSRIFSDDAGKEKRARLVKAHIKSVRMRPVDRKDHCDRNGPNKWKPFKDFSTNVLGNKCWYTEVELTGASLVVDHFRPVCDYWWLAYDPENYRIACSWANSSKHNPLYDCAGGKGDQFPLLPPGVRASGKSKLRVERSVILDPCVARDCELLAFQSDGRPVLHPNFANDDIALERVNKSKIILNLDHPAFNSKREQLCNDINDDVNTHEALPAMSPLKARIQSRLVRRIDSKSPYCTAALFYLRLHRHLDWVEAILIANT